MTVCRPISTTEIAVYAPIIAFAAFPPAAIPVAAVAIGVLASKFKRNVK